MTRLTETTQVFSRPRFQPQGPDSNCIIDGHYLGWDSCTCYAGAMAVDATTAGKQRPSGCAVRRATGDVSGGTMLRQVADAVMKLNGIFVEVHTGSNVLTPQRVAALVRAGRRVVIQGNADAMLGTTYQSTAGPVNHAVMVNEVRGGTVSEPDYALVYDPAADGRKRSYHVDLGPTWWPWSMVKKFCANLRPAGDGTPRLGSGKVYVGVFPDSEPHVILATNASKAKPFPDRVRADEATVRIRAGRTNTSKVLYTVSDGRLLVLYQYARGDSHEGSTLWGGNDDGTEWVHTKNIRHLGGST